MTYDCPVDRATSFTHYSIATTTYLGSTRANISTLLVNSSCEYLDNRLRH